MLIAHDKVTVTLDGQMGILVLGTAAGGALWSAADRGEALAGWISLAKRIGSAIRDHVSSGTPAVGDPPPLHVPNETELRQARIQRVSSG